MKIFTKSAIAAAVLAATSTTVVAEEAVATSELSANAAVVTNYVFRGFSFSDEGPAVQGGVDYAHETGVYVGTWLSTIDNGNDTGLEYDLYLGYAGEAGDIGYDVGYITYRTSDEDKLGKPFNELYITASYDMFSAGYYNGNNENTDNGYNYIELGADIEGVIPMDTVLSLHYGRLDGDDVADAVNDFSIGVSKDIEGFGVSTTYTSEDATDENYLWVGVSKDFAL